MLRSTVVGTPVPIDFTGFVPISPAEINLRHQLALVPTIDRKFGKVTGDCKSDPRCDNGELGAIVCSCKAVLRLTPQRGT